MDNQNETLGLRVLSVSPSHLESNVNVNSSISVTFTSDVNPSTLAKNIVVFEDYNKVYKDIESLKDYSQYSVVKGNISYKDKILTYTPEKPFNTDSSYILVLNDKITDIVGNKLIQKSITVFYTESVASYKRCEIISPKYGLITDTIPTFKWVNQKAPSYVFQISKSNSFELLLLNKVVPGNDYEENISYIPEDLNFKEGMYFVRVKCEGGEWSDTFEFFVKPITDAVIAQEDTSDMINYQDFFDNLLDPIVILEQYPAPDSVNNSLKTNITYIKIKGKLDESRINLSNCYIYGESLDDEHDEYAHVNVNGYWSVIYDSFYDATYIVFTFNNLIEETSEEETKEEISEEETSEEIDNKEINNEETKDETNDLTKETSAL